MTDRITELTEEQKRELSAWYDAWFAIGSSTQPADRKTAEDAMRRAYEEIGEDPPTFFWVDSPLSAALLIKVLSILGKKLKEVRSDPWGSSLENKLSIRHPNMAYPTNMAMSLALRKYLSDRLFSSLFRVLNLGLNMPISDELENHLNSPLENRLVTLRLAYMSCLTSGTISSDLLQSLMGYIVTALHQPIHWSLGTSIANEVNEFLVNPLHSPLDSRLHQALPTSYPCMSHEGMTGRFWKAPDEMSEGLYEALCHSLGHKVDDQLNNLLELDPLPSFHHRLDSTVNYGGMFESYLVAPSIVQSTLALSLFDILSNRLRLTVRSALLDSLETLESLRSTLQAMNRPSTIHYRFGPHPFLSLEARAHISRELSNQLANTTLHLQFVVHDALVMSLVPLESLREQLMTHESLTNVRRLLFSPSSSALTVRPADVILEALTHPLYNATARGLRERIHLNLAHEMDPMASLRYELTRELGISLRRSMRKAAEMTPLWSPRVLFRPLRDTYKHLTQAVLDTLHEMDPSASLRSELTRALGVSLQRSMRNESGLNSLWYSNVYLRPLSGIHDRLLGAVMSALDELMESKEALEYPPFWHWGSMDSHWIAFYSFCNEVLGIKYAEEDMRRMRIHQDLAKSCGWVVAYKGICILCERPEEIHWSKEGPKVLHRDMGPAVRYRDGFSVWSLHDVRVSRELAETPADQLPVEMFTKEPNAEIRREFLRKVGVEQFCRKLGSTILDQEGFYELHEIDLGGETGAWPCLKMKNPSLGCYHMEWVSRDCKTVKEALRFRNQSSLKPEQLT